MRVYQPYLERKVGGCFDETPRSSFSDLNKKANRARIVNEAFFQNRNLY